MRFYANTAEYNHAKANAECALRDALYKDVVSRLNHLRSLADSADRHTLQLAITDMIGDLRR